MTHLQIVAAVAFILWVTYAAAFYAEGLKSQGSPGVKTIGSVAESFILIALVWAVFWS